MTAPAAAGARGERPRAAPRCASHGRALVRAGPEGASLRADGCGGSRVTDPCGGYVCAGRARMHLYYHLGEDGKRVYTLKKKDPEGKVRLRASCAACVRACVRACRPLHVHSAARSRAAD